MGAGARSERLELAIDRRFAAGPARVFAALSDPAELVRWWGPRGFTIPTLSFEPRVGAGYRIEMQPPDAPSFHLRGEFREVDPPSRLAYTFSWEDPDPDDSETLVTLDLEDRSGSTAVALRQGAFKTEARLELHRAGWSDSFDKLERLIGSSSDA